ncbi:MAG: MBOAT family protein [Syntrophomonadaceae bacterium]|nr:MBOAT family protein [Syntrophomonadaceae bacterium]MDD3022307.1 MBOAT family protein [Syntrophomonadaceae bacterium]
MSFNSFQFIFAFLPLTLITYYLIARYFSQNGAKIWLLAASLFFYAFASPYYLLILLASIIFNLFIGRSLLAARQASNASGKILLSAGIGANCGLLVYLKYYNFLLANVNTVWGTNIPAADIILPLGISFFTFVQIAFLADIYRRDIADFNLLDYLLSISFFPKLLSGPITRFKEMAPQLNKKSWGELNYDNLSKGLYIFFIGLFKKLVIADTLALFANSGFDQAASLSCLEGWAASLAYTLQIYFDFSGYTDMAIGVAWMFNISLPFNFDSPYQAKNVRDFWKKWHMTLTRFLTAYIYIPLGGNRRGETRALLNIMITFIISGIWHGAGWTFIFWGFLHGLALVIYRLWNRINFKIPSFAAWFITFNFVNMAWVFFRAQEWKDAINVLAAMFGQTQLLGFKAFASILTGDQALVILIVMLAVIIIAWPQNTNYYSYNFVPTRGKLLILLIIIAVSMLYMNSITPKGFIYNDF